MSDTMIRTPGDLVRECLERAARRHGVSVDEITSAGPKPTRAHAHARQEACWRLRDIRRADGSARLSYPRIATLLGYKDHTSALCAVRDHKRRMAE